MWPVAFVGGLRYEAPRVNGAGKVVGWKTVFDPHRPFAIDMAGFAVNLRLILQRSQAYFKLRGVKGGYQESSLLRELVTLSDLEPKAANCTKVGARQARSAAQASSCPRGSLLIRDLHSQWTASLPPGWRVCGPSGSHTKGGQGDEEGAPRQAKPRNEFLPHHASAGLHTSMPDTPTCVHTHAHVGTCVHMHTHTCICQCTCTDMHRHGHMCVHACAHTPMHVHTSTSVCAQYTRTHRRAHTCSCICSCTHMHRYVFLPVWTSPDGDQAGT